MAKIWKIGSPFQFQEISTNLFVISFECQGDKWRVMEGRPWLFDNYLLVLKPFDGLVPPQKMSFDCEDFWVQMNNLSLACMNHEVGQQIGGTIGDVKGLDVREDGTGWGSYRVRIGLNLKKAIVRGRTVNLLGEKMWIPLRYEKLPRMCFKCGFIVHGGKGCSNTGTQLLSRVETSVWCLALCTKYGGKNEWETT